MPNLTDLPYELLVRIFEEAYLGTSRLLLYEECFNLEKIPKGDPLIHPLANVLCRKTSWYSPMGDSTHESQQDKLLELLATSPFARLHVLHLHFNIDCTVEMDTTKLCQLIPLLSNLVTISFYLTRPLSRRIVSEPQLMALRDALLARQPACRVTKYILHFYATGGGGDDDLLFHRPFIYCTNELRLSHCTLSRPKELFLASSVTKLWLNNCNFFRPLHSLFPSVTTLTIIHWSPFNIIDGFPSTVKRLFIDYTYQRDDAISPCQVLTQIEPLSALWDFQFNIGDHPGIPATVHFLACLPNGLASLLLRAPTLALIPIVVELTRLLEKATFLPRLGILRVQFTDMNAANELSLIVAEALAACRRVCVKRNVCLSMRYDEPLGFDD